MANMPMTGLTEDCSVTDDGEDRYEAGSAAWVSALSRYAETAVSGKIIDDNFTFCAEYTDPPPHLVRRDGRSALGYVVQIKDGRLSVFDGVRHDVDYRVTAAYDPVALNYSLRGDGFLKWVTEHGPRLIQEGKLVMTGDQSVSRRLPKFLDLADFYAKHTR